jgi:tRNA nucleotidyltransferase (CCA-adding enzyme)
MELEARGDAQAGPVVSGKVVRGPAVRAPGADDLLERLRSQPGGVELLAAPPPGSFLVGGAVRDLLLGRRPRELDVVVEGEGSPFGRAAASLAGRLASRFGTFVETSEHERFGTATVQWDGGRIDVATARTERYASPGALPEVEPAPLAEDLLRRDFTVNALALALAGERPGELRGAPHALEDLRAGRLRVLHERSFLDDPTRLWRLARYSARLGFAVEEGTARLAAAAVAQGAPGTVSGARIGAELRLALVEPDPLATLTELERLGLLEALHPRLRFEAPLARRALELLATVAGGQVGGISESARAENRPDLLLLATLTLPLALRADSEAGGHPKPEIAALLDRLEFPGAERDRVAAAAAAVPRLLDELPRAATPSRLRALALSVPPEGFALSGAVSESAAPAARRWLEEVRHVRLRITGEDLLAAGVPQGPEVGRRLEETLRMRLDGELPDAREAQLAAALGMR